MRARRAPSAPAEDKGGGVGTPFFCCCRATTRERYWHKENPLYHHPLPLQSLTRCDSGPASAPSPNRKHLVGSLNYGHRTRTNLISVVDVRLVWGVGGVVPMAVGGVGPRAFTASCYFALLSFAWASGGARASDRAAGCSWGVPWGRGARVEVRRWWCGTMSTLRRTRT